MGILTVIASVGAVALGLTQVAEGGLFNAVVPNLSTGWFAKPGPTESLIFGLLVLKVMALRLAGVFPYNLNEIWQEGGLLGEQFWKRNARAKRDLYFARLNKFSKAGLLQPSEVDAVHRILLGLRRIDSHDCLIRHVCQIKQNQIAGKSSEYEDTILKIFSLKAVKESAKGEATTWDIYRDALTPEVIDCRQKYRMCPLGPKDMTAGSILSGLF